jgi:hypothetical protein
MPLDNSMYPDMNEEEWMPRESKIYDRSFAWFPHRCTQSNYVIWFQWGRRYQQWVGYGDSRYSKWIWLTEQEYLIYCLKAGNE